MNKKLFHIILILCFAFHANAQQNVTGDSLKLNTAYQLGLYPKTNPSKVKGISVGGFYRFFATYNQMDSASYLLAGNPVGGFYAPQKNLFIGDDSQLPNLYLYITGRTSKRSGFNLDIYSFQFLDGINGEAYTGQVNEASRPSIFNPLQGVRLAGGLGLNLGIDLTGQFSTAIGDYEIRMGGTSWYNISDLTYSTVRGYNRFMLFEKNPWDPVESQPENRMNRFYNEGAIVQDQRWGNRAFRGLIIDGRTPGNSWSFGFMHGKTELNGGVNSLPNNSTGGKIRYHLDNGGYYGLNTFNSKAYTDSLALDAYGFNMATIEFKQNIVKGIELHAEIGGGRYYTFERDTEWGEAIQVKLNVNKDISPIPFEVHYYRIGDEVFNNNANFWNTTIEETVLEDQELTAQSTGVLIPFASAMTSIGQMTNNRTGLNLNFDLSVGKLNWNVGYGVSSEITPNLNPISFGHPVNQLTRSRLWRWNFPSDVGPYSRYNVIYRDTYDKLFFNTEFVAVLDPFKKHFNNLEIQGKYKTFIRNKSLYLFYVGRYNTAASSFSIVPRYSEKSLIRQYVSEGEIYYSITKNFLWMNYIGYERTIANYDTETDLQSERPRNQFGRGIGTGFEFGLGKNASIIVQHRWYDFEDRSFDLDRFSGREVLVELKSVF